MFDFNDLKDLAKISERIIEESGRPRHLEGIDEDKIISRAKRVEESIESSMVVPLHQVQDRHDFHPVQGKESDGEIMFRFESVIDAQNLYDFMTNMGLVEPGEIKLHISEHQVSVHFASGVLFSKPEVIQTALMAYEDNVVGSEEDAFESMVEIVDDILTERTKVSGAPKKRAKGNPFHDKDGRLSGPDDISGDDGGSFSMGKTKLKFAGKKKSKSGDMVVNFASTKRPCGRKARKKGKNIRCWDGSQMEAVAAVLEKKNKMQYVEDSELEAMVRVLDSIERGASIDTRKDWVPAKATKEDVELDESKVDISPYVNSHGAKPRSKGMALWMFGLDDKYPTNDKIFRFTGKLADAKMAALKAGKKSGANVVYLLP